MSGEGIEAARHRGIKGDAEAGTRRRGLSEGRSVLLLMLSAALVFAGLVGMVCMPEHAQRGDLIGLAVVLMQGWLIAIFAWQVDRMARPKLARKLTFACGLMTFLGLSAILVTAAGWILGGGA